MKESDLKELELELRKRIRGEVSFNKVTLGIYATDASIYQIKPLALALPRDEEDVRAIVKTAYDYNVSILPRGAGTSLAGQAVSPSLIIDFTKYMNRILEVNVKERWVRVQPGIVLDELNAVLTKYNLHFAPDPATSNVATIGGMIGNNSSGTKSIIYGITRDHVMETKTLLSDGTVLHFKEHPVDEYEQNIRYSNKNTRELEILNGLKRLVETNHNEIEKRYPRLMRSVQGYNLDSFINTDYWNLSNLIVGSEGTLGIVLEAKLNLEPLPKSKVLCTVHFTDLLKAIRSVSRILKHKPSAVEILDEDVIIRARENLKTAPLCSFIKDNPKAILIVEFFGDTTEQATRKAKDLVSDMQSQNLGYYWPVISDKDDQANVWAVRKDGTGLLLGIKGDRKPVPFIEDSAVPIDFLPEYIDQILQFCKKRDVPVIMYAHASVGTIHIRPVLNLKDRKDIDNMKNIAEFSFELVKKYGGSLSGEHGDGRIRSPYLERYFGPQIYNALREVKKLFDPAGLMNPGIIIDPNPMDQDLRYGTEYKTPIFTTEYHYREDGTFAQAIERCNGVGDCRQNLVGTMCPSYRITRDEEHSTRGRANALRLAMTGQLGLDGKTSERLYEIMDLCLSCKSCKLECPSNVDLARLKSEFLQKYHDAHRIKLRDRFVASSTKIAKIIAGWKAPFVNRVQKTFLFRKILEWFIDIDSRRILPYYARLSFAKWFAQRSLLKKQSQKKIVLFNDTYMNYFQTNVGISAVELLESCGYEVILANAGCCQRPRISHGFLRKAKKEGEKTLRNLDKFIQQGFKIVVCEPGCCSALTDDLPDLIEDEQLGLRIKENVKMIDEFIAREIIDGNCNSQFASPYNKILLHGHCHQKSLYGTSSMKEVFKLVPDLTVEEIESGCCGMAGSFGYEKEHYKMSMQIGESILFSAIRNRKNGTAVVACGFSCRHQIADGTGVQALHWVETLRGKSNIKP
jgi:FAD/FMN-containing dehydrogenase/Fe-S oxidoreductase